METTYTMIGADGLQYGPINFDQIKAWINEGRITGDTKILRSDTNSWLNASQYQELGLAQTAPPALLTTPSSVPAPSVASPAPVTDPYLLRRVRSAASWFFFIGICSVINAVMIYTHQGGFFLLGLGVNVMYGGLMVNLVTSAGFAFLGVFARQGQSWAFLVGMLLYTADAVIFFQEKWWPPLAFHAYVLFRIGMGLKANLDLKAQSR